MHTIGSDHPVRSRRPRRRAMALVAGCSIAAAAAFALPAFAGNSPAPKEGDVTVLGCAIAGDGTAVPVEAVAMPLPKGAKIISGKAVAGDGGSVVAPEGAPEQTITATPADGAPVAARPVKGGKDLTATATIGPDGTVTVRGGGSWTAPTKAPQFTYSAVPGKAGIVTSGLVPPGAKDTGTGAALPPQDGVVIEIDVDDLPDCGTGAAK